MPDVYEVFYKRLAILRDEFHRIGKFNDANAKLDELCKLFVLKSLDHHQPTKCGRSRLSIDYLSQLAADRLGDPTRVAGALHAVFAELEAKDPASLSVFGPTPRLQIDAGDDEFATALLPVVESLPIEMPDRWSFDLLNETFGHFIQHSFRHRKEDAQYLTPPEVTSAMVDIGLRDLVRDHQPATPKRPFLVADPTCGVGSFLAASYCQATSISFHGHTLAKSLTFFGQDKVDRMVRLAKVNMQLFTDAPATIQQGNSVAADTLDQVNAKVDLVLTNPPFGASFESQQLFPAGVDATQFPILATLADQQKLPSRIDSEFLMFDRSCGLLRAGGRMLIVVPDKVVAADGFAAAFRQAALECVELLAVIDLPAEAFAQAGTRTKTSIIYLRRPASQDQGDCRAEDACKTQDGGKRIFMANIDDLGYRVTTRAGASVKKQVGTNQLESLADLYRDVDTDSNAGKQVQKTGKHRVREAPPETNWEIHNESPSVSTVAANALLNGRWNASFYRTDRLHALARLRSMGDSFSIRPLGEIAWIDPDHDQRVVSGDECQTISVLHVGEDGFIDIATMDSYKPSSPTVRCQTDDVLVSRINPRIVRICVVPMFDQPIACSPEFAVLRCRDDFDSCVLALLLRSHLVQSQVQTLTSGTSSSHNRIKTRELASIQIPVPYPGPAWETIAAEAKTYRKTLRAYYQAVKKSLSSFELVQRTVSVDCE